MFSEYGKMSEKTEKASFNLPYWQELLLKARAYRISCGWEAAANDGKKIRNNDLPLREIKSAPGWKGKFYKDNWLWKGIKWLVSMQTGAVISLDLKAYDGFGDESLDVYETEVNYGIDNARLSDVAETCLYDRYYSGLGVMRGIWNTKAITNNFRTGSPKYDYVDPMDIYFDPNSRQKNKSDLRYMFHEMRYDTAELKRMYPKYADMIQSQIDSKRLEASNTTVAYILQYKRTITVEKVFIQDEDSGISDSFLVDEWNEHIAVVGADSKTMEQYQQSGSVEDYSSWLLRGGWLAEKVTMSGPIEVEENAVYQAIVIPDLDLVLEYPQYVGENYSYFFLIGYHNPDCAYPFGLCFYMQDMLEISVILMTVLTIQAVKMYQMEKQIQAGALVNEKEYKEKGYQLGVNPIVDESWQKAHPGTDAVKYLHLPEFPSYLMTLNENIVQAQKTMTGAVDSAIGLATYSNQSGVQVANLQMASRVYTKDEFDGFSQFINQAGTWMKDMISLYRNYPHKIKGLDEQNKFGLVEVATNISNRLNAANYFTEVTMQESYEIVKQIEKEFYTTLLDRKLITPLEYMRICDVPNADKKVDDAATYYGDKAYLDAIQQNPEIKSVIDRLLSGGQEQVAQ